MFNAENHLGVELRVIPLRGYQRSAWYDQTGLQWIGPSPNLRTLTQATLYPGVALVEGAAEDPRRTLHTQRLYAL